MSFPTLTNQSDKILNELKEVIENKKILAVHEFLSPIEMKEYKLTLQSIQLIEELIYLNKGYIEDITELFSKLDKFNRSPKLF